jgi:hypothetical protein
MTTAVIRSFESGLDLVHVLLVGTLCETALRVRGSDRSIVARLGHGEPIQFELVRDQRGRECASISRPCVRLRPHRPPQ